MSHIYSKVAPPTTNIHNAKYPTNDKTKLYIKSNEGDHGQLSTTNPKFLLKIDHPPKHNPKYPQLMHEKKRKKIKEKKGEDLEQPYQVRCWVHLNYTSSRWYYGTSKEHQSLLLVSQDSRSQL